MPEPLRLLMVEDSEDDAFLLLRALRQAGYEVNHMRVSTADGLARALAEGGWEIAVVDYIMPGFSGLAALAQIRESRTEIPCILTSSILDQGTASAALGVGAKAFIAKDQMPALVEAIGREKGAPAAPGVIEPNRRNEARPFPPGDFYFKQPFLTLKWMIVMVGLIITVVFLVSLTVYGLHSINGIRAMGYELAMPIATGMSMSITREDPDPNMNSPFERVSSSQAFVTDMQRINRRLMVIDRYKRIVVSTTSHVIGEEYNHDPGNEVRITLGDGKPRNFIDVQPFQHPPVYVGVVPVRNRQGDIVGALILEIDPIVAQLIDNTTQHLLQFGLLLLLVFAIGGIVSLVVYRSTMQPMAMLTYVAQKIGSGDLNTRLVVTRTDPIGRLANTFEAMRQRLQHTSDERNAQVVEREKAEAAAQEANIRLGAWVEQARLRSQELSTLNALGKMLQSCMVPAETYPVIAQAAGSLFPQESGALYLASEDGNGLERVLAWGDNPPAEEGLGTNDCWALRQGRPYQVLPGQATVRCAHVTDPAASCYICQPLQAQGQNLGLLHLRCPDPTSNDSIAIQSIDERVFLVGTLGDSVALALSNLQLTQSLRQQSIRDALTGLYNRRYLDETLQREASRLRRSKGTLSIIMMDIDHFKSFNDTYGHEAGDEVLRAIGTFLNHHTRGEDIAARYGGEELALVLPGATMEVAQRRAEEIRQGIEKLKIKYGDPYLRPVTVSLGVAQMPDHGTTPEETMAAADAAMYRAKQGGRNRVETAG